MFGAGSPIARPPRKQNTSDSLSVAWPSQRSQAPYRLPLHLGTQVPHGRHLPLPRSTIRWDDRSAGEYIKVSQNIQQNCHIEIYQNKVYRNSKKIRPLIPTASGLAPDPAGAHGRTRAGGSHPAEAHGRTGAGGSH